MPANGFRSVAIFDQLQAKSNGLDTLVKPVRQPLGNLGLIDNDADFRILKQGARIEVEWADEHLLAVKNVRLMYIFF